MTSVPLFPKFQKECLPYSQKICYPGKDAVLGFKDRGDIPFGYQPKQPNPGGLSFQYLNYPFPQVNGKLKQHPGRGWYQYDTTGVYYGPW